MKNEPRKPCIAAVVVALSAACWCIWVSPDTPSSGPSDVPSEIAGAQYHQPEGGSWLDRELQAIVESHRRRDEIVRRILVQRRIDEINRMRIE